MEEVVQLLPSLLQLSGSFVVDVQLITSIARLSSQHTVSVLTQTKQICDLYLLNFQRTSARCSAGWCLLI